LAKGAARFLSAINIHLFFIVFSPTWFKTPKLRRKLLGLFEVLSSNLVGGSITATNDKVSVKKAMKQNKARCKRDSIK
jgi:hypothetical protein